MLFVLLFSYIFSGFFFKIYLVVAIYLCSTKFQEIYRLYLYFQVTVLHGRVTVYASNKSKIVNVLDTSRQDINVRIPRMYKCMMKCTNKDQLFWIESGNPKNSRYAIMSTYGVWRIANIWNYCLSLFHYCQPWCTLIHVDSIIKLLIPAINGVFFFLDLRPVFRYPVWLSID